MRRYVSGSGPPISYVSPIASRRPSTPVRSSSASSRAIGWVRVSTQRGVTITGRRSTSWRRISQLMPPSPITMPARNAVVGAFAAGSTRPRAGCAGAATGRRCRRPGRRDRRLGQARGGGGVRERVRAGPVAVGEVGVGEGVHEVVRGVVAGEHASQAVAVADVGPDGSPGSGVALGSAGDRGDVVTGVSASVSRRPSR